MKEAIRIVHARDQEEKDVFKRLYGICNPYNQKWIDLVIDTSNNTPKQLANMVIKASRVL